jgi:hypothetical protein
LRDGRLSNGDREQTKKERKSHIGHPNKSEVRSQCPPTIMGSIVHLRVE